jgi:hypothetical protein
MFKIKIDVDQGELAKVVLEQDIEGTTLTTIYDTDADCMSCDRYRLISGQTACCFECDNVEFVKSLKVLLGLDDD